MSNLEISKRRDAAVARGVGMQTQVYAQSALNAEVWDVEAIVISTLPLGLRWSTPVIAIQK